MGGLVPGRRRTCQCKRKVAPPLRRVKAVFVFSNVPALVGVVVAKQSKTPAQKKRNRYVATVRARGASGYNLWFVAPSQDPPDPPLLLCSDVELECFLYLEGSADLVTVDYAPLRLVGEEPRSNRRHFAIARTLDGHEIDIDLDPGGETTSPPARRLINLATLNAARSRVESWRAINAAINRCRSHQLAPVVFRCRHIIENQQGISLATLCGRVEESEALVVGAVGTMLRARELASDVDERLWGPATRLWGRSYE